jgi:site-specific recombinase XerD
MRRKPYEQTRAKAVPTTAEVVGVWRADRCLADSTARSYLDWIKRFRAYCGERRLDERTELTLEGSRRFIAWYARRRGLDPGAGGSCSNASAALLSLSRAYQVLCLDPPLWTAAAARRPAASPLLRAFEAHLLDQRGNAQSTVRLMLTQVAQLLIYLSERGVRWRTMKLTDVDAFLVACSGCYARATTANIACSVRAFMRFLLATGRSKTDLSASVVAPVLRKHEQPRRALPWEDVQRLLRAVDRSSAIGLRDHAILLLMSTYGLGAGEVIRLSLDDIGWTSATLNVVRPKTGVAFTLPLLPALARVLARYVRDGRPQHTPTRHLFIRMEMPFGPLGGATAVCHILHKHAKAAGLHTPSLGSHVLRHSHASRQIDLGARPRVVSDILGHSDSESISAYVRIATERLREVSLPLPS